VFSADPEAKPMFSNTFPTRHFVAETVAKMLLEIKAVHFNATSLTSSPQG
jgi:hypothetical protein